MRIAVAVSGGRDSTALLHCTVRQAAALGIHVHALHVHHGLLPQADAWVRQLRRQVQRWARRGWPVGLHVTHLQTTPRRGESVEAWARQARYTALATIARELGCRAVLLAHHRQDQAETVLLQMLRRSQPGALAAMSETSQRDGMVWLRPWLGHDVRAIDAYVKRHRLGHVVDPSNLDPRLARARLRQRVWVPLEQAFPEAAAAIGETARQVSLWREVVEHEVARQLEQVCDPSGLHVERWSLLSAARRELVLRAWLEGLAPAWAGSALVARLLRELPGADAARWPLAGEGGELVLYRGVLCRRPTAAAPQPQSIEPVDLSVPGEYRIPGVGGRLQVRATDGPGVPCDDLRHAEWRSRQGGERFQAGRGRPARALKKQYQAAGVPAWHRDAPLLWSGNRLLFVPGLGVDARSMCDDGAPRRCLHWAADVSEEQGGKP